MDGPIDAPKTVADVRREPYPLPDRLVLRLGVTPGLFVLHAYKPLCCSPLACACLPGLSAATSVGGGRGGS